MACMSGMVTHSKRLREMPYLSASSLDSKSAQILVVMVAMRILPGSRARSANEWMSGCFSGLMNHHMWRKRGSLAGSVGSRPPSATPVIFAPPALATASVLG